MTTLEIEQIPTYDFMGLSSLDDPYPVLGELRRASPLVKAAMPLTWAVTRHDEVAALLRDDRLGHQFPRHYISFVFGEGPGVDFFQNILLNRDAPDHTRLRDLMGKAFRGLTVRKLHDHIKGLVDALLEPALDRGSFDIVSDLAYPLPVQVICELLGLSADDRDEVRVYAADLVGTDMPALHRATTWMREYIGAQLIERRPDADGDLLERMLAAEEGEDALTHEEIVDNAILLFFAGFETTTNLIGNGCAALLRFPGEKERLLADPTLAATAVEEFLRFDTPLPMVNRITREPMLIGGQELPEMQVIQLLLASANHDEDVFDRPDELDIGRKPNPHVGFGGGIHHCLGAMLARVEGEIVFHRLAERIKTLEANGQAVRRHLAVRGFLSIPVKTTPA
jgi:cytochrome P450